MESLHSLYPGFNNGSFKVLEIFMLDILEKQLCKDSARFCFASLLFKNDIEILTINVVLKNN